MDTEKSNKYFRSNMKMVDFARRYWKFLSGVAVVSGILAVVFSGPKFIAPKYTSVAVFYPANLGVYSGENRIDQFQQYLESNLIRDSIISKYNLYEEYDIDPDYEHAKTYVNLAFSEHVTFEKTRYESIRIAVSSIDPQKAKLMADDILNLVNYVKRKGEREKYKENMKIDKRMMDEKKNQVDSLLGKLQVLSKKHGLLDYASQSEEVTEGYMQAMLQGKSSNNFEAGQKLYDNLKDYGLIFNSLKTQLDSATANYSRYLVKYEESRKNYLKEITYSYILVRPEVADKKSSPVRWAIVLAAILSSVGFAFLMMLVLGYQKKKDV